MQVFKVNCRWVDLEYYLKSSMGHYSRNIGVKHFDDTIYLVTSIDQVIKTLGEVFELEEAQWPLHKDSLSIRWKEFGNTDLFDFLG